VSAFTDREIEYLASQRLARLATATPDGRPHVVPVAFRLNPEHDTIDVGGHSGFASRKKYRDVLANPHVAVVVDDAPGPGRPRGIEIRGRAEVLPTGGPDIVPSFDPEMFRITPERIVSWGIEPGPFRMHGRTVR
jgi:pyridoxamine 5'-phosphate oxidase family protein